MHPATHTLIIAVRSFFWSAIQVKQHAKIAAKSGDFRFQWQILETGCYIPAQEIPKFADPQYWLDYFPPRAVEALKMFGLKVSRRQL